MSGVALAPPTAIFVDRGASVMLGFLVDNLDLTQLPSLTESEIDAACDALFPSDRESLERAIGKARITRIALEVSTDVRAAALALLADFAAHSDASAIDHQRMLDDGDDPPCSPAACARAASACRAAYYVLVATQPAQIGE